MSSLNDIGFEPFEDSVSNAEDIGFEPFESQTEQENPSQIPRHLARTGSRILETIGGLPGDVIQFIKNIGETLPEVPSFLKREPSFIQEAGKKALEKIPTSQSLKEKSEKITKGYTAPESELEALGDEITSLTTALAFPAKDPIKFKSLLGALGKAIAVKSAGKGAELLGAEEGGKAATELGTLFLTGLLGKKTANEYVSQQFKEARNKIPKGTMIPTDTLVKGLEGVESDLSRGLKTATKSEVLSSVSDLKKKALGGAMEADELVEAYHNINEKLNAKKLFDELSKAERKQLKARYDMFKNQVGNAIQDYGKYNPEFYNQWKNANNAYATIAQSKKVSNFFQSHIGSLPKHLALGIAAELFLGYPKTAALTAAGAGAVKSGELLYRITKSPILRKHYLDVIDSSLKENLPGVIKSLNALDEELNKEDSHP